MKEQLLSWVRSTPCFVIPLDAPADVKPSHLHNIWIWWQSWGRLPFISVFAKPHYCKGNMSNIGWMPWEALATKYIDGHLKTVMHASVKIVNYQSLSCEFSNFCCVVWWTGQLLLHAEVNWSLIKASSDTPLWTLSRSAKLCARPLIWVVCMLWWPLMVCTADFQLFSPEWMNSAAVSLWQSVCRVQDKAEVIIYLASKLV